MENFFDYSATFSEYHEELHEQLANYIKIYSPDLQKELRFHVFRRNETTTPSSLIRLDEKIECGSLFYQNFSFNISIIEETKLISDIDITPYFFTFKINIDKFSQINAWKR